VTVIIVFVLLAALSYFGVGYYSRIAWKYQILDKPNERSSHSKPVPLGGGLAITLIVLATSAWVANEIDWRRSLIYIVSASIMAWMGWRDDVHSLPAWFRLLVQGLIATASIWGMGYFKVVAVPLFGDVQLGVVGIIITFLWIVGLTNAYNFMDGIDGNAGGVAFIAALGWMWLSADTHKWFVFWTGLAIAASSLGFLGHNWTPAKVFMGDVGSTFLGYTFAVLSLVSADQGGDALLIGTLLMWIVIMDSFVTFLNRLLKRENVFSGHRSHLFQRLVIGGYKHTTISLFYMLLTAVAAMLAYLWSQDDHVAPVLIFFGLPSLWLLLSMHASRLEGASQKPRRKFYF
jgi:UDP-N-acetylmuramyl pentapeptide phosphotransferase/UDP-N-acetylglucosamine-1-phosphate transferase